eukprot:NODE_25_length_41203_cov_0.917113.p5 type:complete len:994 gc:universal NODE_25_length_41203_cov_0.917113:34188-37169(+)
MILLTLIAATFKVFGSHFQINGIPTLLRSGSLQWYRLDKSQWKDRLSKLSAIYNVLEMYVSWQYIEPRPNEFQLDDLKEFLQLASEYPIYIYIRPGPYICNEENSGGFPGWVIANSNKIINPDRPDGMYALRTNDYDYLKIVERYFDAINQVIQPHLITQGGKIILYQIENEFDHYEKIFEIEKASVYNGEPERPLDSTLDTKDMFDKLRTIVEKYIDIPLNTCPGTIDIDGMGNAEQIMPFPNYYKDANILEYVGMNYKHKQQQKSNYLNFPSGITETFRSASTISRFIISGMDMVNNFNAFGMASSGRKNSMIGHFPGVVDTDVAELWKIFRILFPFKDIRDFRTLYFQFPIGLFPSVVDFNGVVSPSGLLRLHFFNMRRLHLFYETFQHLIAPVQRCKRSVTGSQQYEIKNFSNDVVVRNGLVGSKDPDSKGKRVVYWLETGLKSAFVGLLSEDRSITIEANTIQAYNITFPRYPFVIPKEDFVKLEIPQNHINANSDDFYLMHIPLNIQLHPLYKIRYSTAEVLHYKDGLLLLYGMEGTRAEIELLVKGSFQFNESKMKSSTKFDETWNSVFFTFMIPFEMPITRKIQFSNHTLTIIIMNRRLSGQTYFHKDGVIMGVDFYDPSLNEIQVSAQSSFYYYGDSKLNPAYGLLRNGTIKEYSVMAKHFQFSANLNIATILKEPTPRNLDYSPIPLGKIPEQYNVTEGYIYYQSEIVLDKVKRNNKLYIEHASDFISIFVNSNFVIALVPIGSRIKSDDGSFRYKFKIPSKLLKIGKNSITIRADIWGRGSFLFPRGKVGYLPVFNTQIPLGFKVQMGMLGFDGIKGIYGETKFNDDEIVWKYKIGLIGEDNRYFDNFNNSTKVKYPLYIPSGEVQFINYIVEIPSKIPLTLKLLGSNLKADIYMNGKIQGRWISDDEWLKKGSSFQIDRSALSLMNMDHFPIPKCDNLKLSLIVDSKNGGKLDRVEIGLPEEQIKSDGSTYYLPSSRISLE